MYDQHPRPDPHTDQDRRPDPHTRVGDAERERTGDRLRQAHAEGRLDPEEFHDRLDRSFEAKTAGELHELVGDLPAEPAERAAESWASTFALGLGRRRAPLVPILLTLLVVSAVVQANGHEHGPGPWILIPLFFLARLWVGRGLGYGRRRSVRRRGGDAGQAV